MEESRKYYFAVSNEGRGSCLERCIVLEDVMIGSLFCQSCEHCLEYGDELHATEWIRCTRIDEALDKGE